MAMQVVKPQKRGLKTRERLMAVAVKCLVKEGIHGLRYSHIAKQAKIPQALMGYHFPNMESLLMAVIQLELEKLKVASTDAVERNASQPKRALAAYIRTPFDLALVDIEFRAVWTAFYHLCTIEPTFANLNLGIRKLGRERILNLITIVLATEGLLVGEENTSRARLIDLAASVQAVITGFIVVTATESNADYRKMSDLAIANVFRVLGI